MAAVVTDPYQDETGYTPLALKADIVTISHDSAGHNNADAVKGGETLLAASRRRLELWDIPHEEIERLEKTRQIEKNLTLRSPVSGWVMERNIAAGHKIMQGESLLVVADLTAVWGDADIYESDLPYVQLGMPVELTLPYWSDKTFTGKVIFLSRHPRS